MVGSTFVHAPDPAPLIALGLDAVDGFPNIALDVLVTLDFTAMAAGWSSGPPLRYDEAGGLAIFKVSPRALAAVLAAPEDPEPDRASDVDTLRRFVATHGPDNLYEVATF